MPLRSLLAVLVLLVGCSSPAPSSPTPSDPGPTPPPPAQSLYGIVSEAADLSVLTTLVDASGLATSLEGGDPLTLFAPSNEAFAALQAGTVEAWLQPGQRDALVARLSAHVVPSRIASSDLRDGQTLRTLSGETLRVRIANGQIQVGAATLIATNVEARNGTLHVVDAVLTP